MMSSGGYGKGSKGSKGSKGGYDDDYYPEECVLVSYHETFSIDGPDLFLAPDTTVDEQGTPTFPGTVFIFPISPVLEFETFETAIAGSTVSGICTRTTVGEPSGGICQLVFVDDDGYTINVSGFLKGEFGSQMAITGGTGSTVGVVGTMDFFPIYEDTDSNSGINDIFLNATRYDVIAEIGVLECPETYHHP